MPKYLDTNIQIKTLSYGFQQIQYRNNAYNRCDTCHYRAGIPGSRHTYRKQTRQTTELNLPMGTVPFGKKIMVKFTMGSDPLVKKCKKTPVPILQKGGVL